MGKYTKILRYQAVACQATNFSTAVMSLSSRMTAGQTFQPTAA